MIVLFVFILICVLESYLSIILRNFDGLDVGGSDAEEICGSTVPYLSHTASGMEHIDMF